MIFCLTQFSFLVVKERSKATYLNQSQKYIFPEFKETLKMKSMCCIEQNKVTACNRQSSSGYPNEMVYIHPFFDENSTPSHIDLF